jgi:hypothetical protein
VLCLLRYGGQAFVSLSSGGVRRRLQLSACASRLTPPDYPPAVLMATQIGSILSPVGGPDTRPCLCQFIPFTLSWQWHVIGSAAARSLLERSTMSINAWGCMVGKVRARWGSRVFMLAVSGLVPVLGQARHIAPGRGRSEEERPLSVLPVACPRREGWR